ncbi:MAG: LysM peptidoglycan-binding domain-containing protein [Pseudomonadota bacterium]
MEPASSLTSLWVTSALVVATGAVGTTTWYMMREAPAVPVDPPAVEVALTPEPEAETVEAPAPSEEMAEAEAVETAPTTAPTFDVVRVDKEGKAIVAGEAEPGAMVSVLIDEEESVEAEADGSGRFVAFLSIPPSAETRVMALRARLGDAVSRSNETVIISPVQPAPKVAAVEAPLEAEADAGHARETHASEGSAAPRVAAAEAPAAPTAPGPAGQSDVARLAQDADPAAPTPPASLGEPEAVAALDAGALDTPAAPLEGLTQPEEAAEPMAMAAPASPTPAPAPDVTETAAVAPQLLLADEGGLSVLQSPEALDNVALDTISYDDAGEVSLGGRALGDGFVRVYLDGRAITTSRIEANGTWRTELPEVDTGVYTLRVDEVDAEGTVTSRVETPFRREDPAAVAEIRDDNRMTGPFVTDVMTVQPGATLWAIARERYGEGILYVKVFQANRDRIRNPDLIYPGQVFDLPN